MPELTDSLAGTTSVEDDVRELEVEEEVETKSEETETEETDEEESSEIEETEEVEENKEIPPHERPTITDIKAAFPDLLKKFPSLREIIYREKRYDDEFGNIEAAVAAKNDAESFNNLHEDVFNGDGTKFFSAIREESPEALGRFATKILPTLYKIDERAHWAAANPLLEFVLKGFVEASKDDEKAQDAARLFAKYAFGNLAEDVLAGRKSFVPKAETKEADPERQQFLRERMQTFQGDLDEAYEAGLKAMILEKNKDGNLLIDPDDELSPWLREQLTSSIRKEVVKQILADKEYLKYTEKLWKKAERDKFPSNAKPALVDAFLARARQLVKAVRIQQVSEMRGKTPPSPGKIKKLVANSRRVEAGSGGRKSREGSFDSSRKVDYSKSSDEDIINDQITYK